MKHIPDGNAAHSWLDANERKEHSGRKFSRTLMKILGWLNMAVLGIGFFHRAFAQIPVPSDAPQPFSPKESAALIKTPPGFRMEIVASEPLIREPSGVCWDERGRLFVSELHGYNLEGQYDIEALNRTGELDHQVRRIQANPEAKKAAEAGTYGTVKLLSDEDGDGRMDRVQVFADRLPPCYGLCPARGGVIVACAPDIVFLADRDGDGVAEVREVLFTGFATGALERGINAPQWGLDDWIYFGRGHGGGTITGPHLSQPVRIGGTDFRIKADGSAIEPVTGTTHTFGHAFTETGDRFVVTTSRPGLFVAPMPWRYLARNPDVAAPRTEQSAGEYTRVFPISEPHPWRAKRAQDPGFFKYYRDRYGVSDSDASGYFTSGCGPLVYQDVALPAGYRGAYFMCDPSQNMIHRAVIEREGPALRLRRAAEEETSEFLASRDQWFHPMNLVHGPEGAIYIVDLYREIIEDYSAIPRYLQQQYGFKNGMQHGRIWRLTHRDAPKAPAFDMSGLERDALVEEVASPHFWRRQTARRLLLERRETGSAAALSRLAAQPSTEVAGVLNALYTLEAMGELRPEDARRALRHADPGVRVHGLRFSETFLEREPALLNQVFALAKDPEARVLLQLALTLGESRDPRVIPVLASLARVHGDMNWMPTAILSSVSGRAGALLEELLSRPDEMGSAHSLFEPLWASLAARRDPVELSSALAGLAKIEETTIVQESLRSLKSGLKEGEPLRLAGEGRRALDGWLRQGDPEVRRVTAELVELILMADPAQRKALMAQAVQDAADPKLPVETRLAAVTRLSVLDDPEVTDGFASLWANGTPRVREAILDGYFRRRDRLPAVLGALERGTIAAASLNAFQRLTLVEHEDAGIRERAKKLLAGTNGPKDEVWLAFSNALAETRDLARGEQVFRDHCATCHQVRGIGFVVGPDLGAEFQRAEEAILRDVLAPNDAITAGYATYVIETSGGQSLSGVLANESATSLTLRQAAGLEQVVLTKDIARINTLAVSLMPEALAQTLAPKDAADVIAWLRRTGGEGERGTNRRILFDDEADFLKLLNEGGGRATLETGGAFAGRASLAITPPQRYSVRIPGWSFRIVEKPQMEEEYRYLRLAWKTRGGEGVMLELAGDGRWPDAKSATRRYYAGRNTTAWAAHEVSAETPGEWRVVTLDLWKDNGTFTLTGIAPTAMGGTALFDRIELVVDLRVLGR